ncbi:LOW QUALITY PROTEIN: hypothetical protein PHMEG_00020496 [Phytophthora megakarya]|uniref:Retrotransposon gag domain-containing protein n=1 Tax=Phytophthora megakarya TaxID=4795 RepID=A0A225VNZ7_9STRA|nr:LOW QUALITY PROTEIN: hypothetical protein PHMEG_00020496 [Phytophthora megakarya]
MRQVHQTPFRPTTAYLFLTNTGKRIIRWTGRLSEVRARLLRMWRVQTAPHLADPEWEALQRMSTVIGEAAVATMLRTLSPTEQHGVAVGFIMREQREVASAKPLSPGETPRKEYLKLRVSNYMDREGDTLLRWLVELDTAIVARRLVDPLAKVAFAMSCLGGRARSWAYGRRLTDPTCFSTYESFKEELKLAFEPPQTEFRSRKEFLDLQQGTHDVYAYAQRARYLVWNVVTDPMDEATKVVTFMKGRRAREATCDDSGAETWVTSHGSVRHRHTQEIVDVVIPGIVTVEQRTQGTSRRGAPYW